MAKIILSLNDVDIARQYCIKYHEGQFRKGNNEPYHVHPMNVEKLLIKYGYDDPLTRIIALLHDTVEDADTPDESQLRMDKIQEVFGYEVSNGVYILSKNKGKMRNGNKLSHQDYLQRIYWSRNKIKRIKIADMIDNTKDLQNLSFSGIQEKIRDAEEFYIPLGREISPIMIRELEENIRNYKIKYC